MSGPGATLQVSLSPSDWKHAKFLLPHQVRVWRGQVAEILLTVDLHRSAGRFAAGWEAGRDRIMELAHSIEGARVVPIDYGDEARARVSLEFFGGAPVPAKDFRGGPYYAYFFGLNAASNDLVLHTDSDIFFGGGSQTWLAEAASNMAARQEVLFSSPLPGPPAADGRLLHLGSTPDAAPASSCGAACMAMVASGAKIAPIPSPATTRTGANVSEVACTEATAASPKIPAA